MEKTKNITGKKILYLITQTKWGGAQKYVLELAQHFAKNNEVHIAYGETNDVNHKFITQAKKYNIKTIPVHKLVRQIDAKKDLPVISEIVKILNQNNYQLVHLNSSKAGFIGSLATKSYNLNPLNTMVRVVYTAHGFVFNEPLGAYAKMLYKFSEIASTSMQHVVIAVSKFDQASAIQNKICSPHKIITIHNGIDPNDYHFLEKYQAREKLKLDPKKKHFGTIASFYTTKGHRYLVEAIHILKTKNSPLLKEYSWTLIGSGPESADIAKQIAKYNLNEYIKIIPAQDNDWQYLKAFDCFILPSVKEGLPYTLLEAGLAQIPIIASTVGGVAEIITDEQTGLLVAAANPPALNEAMLKIATAPDLAQKLAQNNYQNIKTNFSLSKTLQETEELYAKLF